QGSESFWDVIVGTGKVWQEAGDGKWSRASFPLTLADRYVGQARNCVATFVYQTDIISKVCVQCSQETADFGNHDAGNIRVTLAAKYQPKLYADSTEVVEQQEQLKAARLPTHPLKEIDADGEVAAYFDDALLTNASTSQGAVWINEKLYVHPPNTRHGAYPYPQEMRHGVYSVTKSMAGALALFYLAERYGDELFDALVTDYVPVLADHSGWQGVTLSQTLSMVSGTVGSDEAEHLLNVLIIARTAEESINNIAKLGDAPDAPGERFNYQSTNLFVLSYALQNYVAAKEGSDVNYWDLVHEGVLVPMGAENFTLRRTIETDGRKGLPILAYGAYPTLDEAAKISLLFINEGRYKGQQLLSKERVRTIFGRAATGGYSTNNDYRGTGYQDSFWSKRIRTRSGKVLVSYMLGYGTNYVLFWSGDTFVIRFMDEFDLDVDKLVREVDKLRIATTSD
ncbi:MAG: serine hydrolase, partial [Bacteroidota bacterium]